MKSFGLFIVMVWLTGCAVEKEPPVTIFEGVVLNDETGEPFGENTVITLGSTGCHGGILGCIVSYSFPVESDGTFSIVMPYGEYEKEKNIVRYIFSVHLADELGLWSYYELVSCGRSDCDDFDAGGKYTLEFRFIRKLR